MSTALACYVKHKKPVCDQCDAGTSCVKFCMCQPRTARGRPRKESESEPESSPLIQRVNPERAARAHHDSNIAAEVPAKDDGSRVSSSQAHILDVLELMDCKELESSVRRLPHTNNRCHVLLLVTSKFAAKM